MKAKKITWISGVWFFMSPCVWGDDGGFFDNLDIGFQPWLQGGVMYYEYEQDNISLDEVTDVLVGAGATDIESIIGSLPGSISIANVSTSKFKVASQMATLGGGFTAYLGRFFVDVSAQKAFENDDDDSLTTRSSGTAVGPGGGTAFATELQSDFDTDFDREDYAVSFGLNVTENFVLFTGYKYAETKFDSDVNGNLTLNAVIGLITNPGIGVTTSLEFTGNRMTTFRQNGPFVGVGYAIPVNQGIFDGQLSAKLAVAFLDGKVNSSNKNFLSVADGIVLPDTTDSIKGDSIGLSIGLNWSGRTGISGLNYMLGINGYQYDFDANRQGDPDFQEFSIGFNAGVGYGF